MRLLKNTVANLAASFLGPVLAIVLTPFYIRHLGLEGYGLVGFFTTLHLLLGVVSAAMGKVYLREIAARTSLPERRQSVPALFQLFLGFFAVWGIAVALAIAALSWWISHRWVHLDHLDPASVRACVLLIAVTLAATLPAGVCTDTLFGLQEHVRANTLSIAIYLLTTTAAVALVDRYNTVSAYYAATAAGAVFTLVFMTQLAYRRLRVHLGDTVAWPSLTEAFRDGKRDTQQVVRDSLLLLWTEGAGVIIAQTDRLLLATLLPLSNLGIYNLGSATGRLVQMTSAPFLTAAYPRLCQISTEPGGDAAAARHAFRQQAIVLVIATAFAMPVCAIPETLLTLWIGDPELAARAGSVSAIFAVAYACLALSGAPYNLAVATHHTRYAAIFNAAAVVWYPLLGYWLIRHFGLTGAALLWLSYCSMATLACTLVAWFIVDRAYCAGWEMARLLAVPVLATALGALARTLPVVAVQPLLSRTAYAAIGSLVILAVGLFVVLGRAGIARLAEGRFERRASASIPPMP